MEEVIQLLHFIRPLSPKLEKHLRSIIRLKKYRAGDIILSPEEICQNIFFVSKGLIRIYHLSDGKEEVSDWFIREGDFCISVGSFFEQTPSGEYHVAMEDCECWGISFDELEDTFNHYPEFNVHGRIISNRYYSELYYRTRSLKRASTFKKYEHLMEGHPDFLLRVSNSHMASYLDISLSSYNKIKSRYLELKRLEKKVKSRHS